MRFSLQTGFSATTQMLFPKTDFEERHAALCCQWGYLDSAAHIPSLGFCQYIVPVRLCSFVPSSGDCLGGRLFGNNICRACAGHL